MQLTTLCCMHMWAVECPTRVTSRGIPQSSIIPNKEAAVYGSQLRHIIAHGYPPIDSLLRIMVVVGVAPAPPWQLNLRNCCLLVPFILLWQRRPVGALHSPNGAWVASGRSKVTLTKPVME